MATSRSRQLIRRSVSIPLHVILDLRFPRWHTSKPHPHPSDPAQPFNISVSVLQIVSQSSRGCQDESFQDKAAMSNSADMTSSHPHNLSEGNHLGANLQQHQAASSRSAHLPSCLLSCNPIYSHAMPTNFVRSSGCLGDLAAQASSQLSRSQLEGLVEGSDAQITRNTWTPSSDEESRAAANRQSIACLCCAASAEGAGRSRKGTCAHLRLRRARVQKERPTAEEVGETWRRRGAGDLLAEDGKPEKRAVLIEKLKMRNHTPVNGQPGDLQAMESDNGPQVSWSEVDARSLIGACKGFDDSALLHARSAPLLPSVVDLVGGSEFLQARSMADESISAGQILSAVLRSNHAVAEDKTSPAPTGEGNDGAYKDRSLSELDQGASGALERGNASMSTTQPVTLVSHTGRIDEIISPSSDSEGQGAAAAAARAGEQEDEDRREKVADAMEEDSKTEEPCGVTDMREAKEETGGGKEKAQQAHENNREEAVHESLDNSIHQVAKEPKDQTGNGEETNTANLDVQKEEEGEGAGQEQKPLQSTEEHDIEAGDVRPQEASAAPKCADESDTSLPHVDAGAADQQGEGDVDNCTEEPKSLPSPQDEAQASPSRLVACGSKVQECAEDVAAKEGGAGEEETMRVEKRDKDMQLVGDQQALLAGNVTEPKADTTKAAVDVQGDQAEEEDGKQAQGEGKKVECHATVDEPLKEEGEGKGDVGDLEASPYVACTSQTAEDRDTKVEEGPSSGKGREREEGEEEEGGRDEKRPRTD
eukprot:725329-Hanusia_phi.AAC.1